MEWPTRFPTVAPVGLKSRQLLDESWKPHRNYQVESMWFLHFFLLELWFWIPSFSFFFRKKSGWWSLAFCKWRTKSFAWKMWSPPPPWEALWIKQENKGWGIEEVFCHQHGQSKSNFTLQTASTGISLKSWLILDFMYPLGICWDLAQFLDSIFLFNSFQQFLRTSSSVYWWWLFGRKNPAKNDVHILACWWNDRLIPSWVYGNLCEVHRNVKKTTLFQRCGWYLLGELPGRKNFPSEAMANTTRVLPQGYPHFPLDSRGVDLCLRKSKLMKSQFTQISALLKTTVSIHHNSPVFHRCIIILYTRHSYMFTYSMQYTFA